MKMKMEIEIAMKFGNATSFEEDFLRKNLMGPNCVRIAEELMQKARLLPGMRVLDLGCGTGLSSILLAKEYDVTVFAADLWIDPSDNYERFRQFGLEDRIIPIHAEAHALPFAHDYFDAMVSIDSYHYYGFEEDYLDTHIVPLIRRGGTIAVSVPGLQEEFSEGIPRRLQPFWEADMNFHSCGWWKALWSRSPEITIERCFSLECHGQAWDDWLECDNPHAKRDVEMMKAENGDYFDTIGIVARVDREESRDR